MYATEKRLQDNYLLIFEKPETRDKIFEKPETRETRNSRQLSIDIRETRIAFSGTACIFKSHLAMVFSAWWTTFKKHRENLIQTIIY